VAVVYSGKLASVIGAISAISGLLMQFFEGDNFYIYNKCLQQMNYFYDRLMQMQDAMLSIKVGDQIQSAELKDQVKEHIAVGLLVKRQSGFSPVRSMKTPKRKDSPPGKQNVNKRHRRLVISLAREAHLHIPITVCPLLIPACNIVI
jgi:hypothetical protein